MGALMRSRTDRRIAGVCGGLARQNSWDSTVVRLIWVALVLFGGTGVLVYIVMWIVVPEEPFALPAGYGPPVGYTPQPPTNYASQPPMNYAPQPPYAAPAAGGYGAAPTQASAHAGGQAYGGTYEGPPAPDAGTPRQG